MIKNISEMNGKRILEFKKLQSEGKLKLIADEYGRKVIWVKKGPQRPTLRYYQLKAEMGIKMDGTGIKCVECSAPATEAHPIDGKHKKYDRRFWVALCRNHHRMRHYPNIFRFIPKEGAKQRQYPRIVAMTHKEKLTAEDLAYLQRHAWGEVFIKTWFPDVEMHADIYKEAMINEIDLE